MSEVTTPTTENPTPLRHALDRSLVYLPTYYADEVEVLVPHHEWDRVAVRMAIGKLRTLLEHGDYLEAQMYHRRTRKGIGAEFDLFLGFRGMHLGTLIAPLLGTYWYGTERVPHIAVTRGEDSMELGTSIPGMISRVLSQILWGTPWKLYYTTQPRR